ncbi:MAG: hypothetical protein J2O49_07425 [Sciscionella sp.]|nr:hypothetical protein [Sciscionella sp.]
MSARASSSRIAVVLGAVALALAGLLTSTAHASPSTAAASTTAWRDGAFHLDAQGVVRRSDIVLGQPNTQPAQSVPLGNGRLGAAVWAANGLTAQLNRNDTMPDRKSPGQVVIPGLAKLTGAADYRGRLDMYHALYQQSGGGMTATSYVRADSDELVVDVTGADPNVTQTADLKLWSPRNPTANAAGGLGTLAESWTDERGAGATHKAFGSLAGITAGGRDVSATVVDQRTVRVSFRPNADGSFRVVVAAPHWTGGTASKAQSTAASAIGGDAHQPTGELRAGHVSWWQRFWGGVGLIEANSSDGVAQYMENLRTIYLYQEAASERDTFPGSQAGIADLFSWNQDNFFWDPAAYWHWNLRMMTAANIGAGAFALNQPYFQLYQQNLSAIEAWTRAQMGGRPGICVPETMRFSGQGYENEDWLDSPGLNCDAASPPYYNARTLTTGAEVGLWVWRQYQWTGDESFLRTNYPVMSEAARFLLAYAKIGTDGKLHTYPSNAHETQWDVHDPTTDIAAERSLYPAVIAAAGHLGVDADLAGKLRTALGELPAFPTTGSGAGQVIAPSYDPDAEQENSENIGLEPVWPYEVIGDQGPQSALAKQTFVNRPNTLSNDWSYDSVDAAMLGLGDQLPGLLSGLVQRFQVYPDGMAVVAPSLTSKGQPYSELSGVVALTLNQALVTDSGGEIRVATGWPSGWNGGGTQFVHGRTKIDVQFTGGVPTTVAIEAGSTQTLRVRNPWPGQRVRVINGVSGSTVVAPTSAADIDVPVTSGTSYLVERTADPTAGQPYAPITGSPAAEYRKLGPSTIGLPSSAG